MTGMEALEYLRTHRYAAVRCKDWDEDVFILTKASCFDTSWAHYWDSDLYERHSVNKHTPEVIVFSIFSQFFEQLYTAEWEIYDAKTKLGYEPVKCGWNEYYNPEFQHERFPKEE